MRLVAAIAFAAFALLALAPAASADVCYPHNPPPSGREC